MMPRPDDFPRPGEAFEDWYARTPQVQHLLPHERGLVKRLAKRAFNKGRRYAENAYQHYSLPAN